MTPKEKAYDILDKMTCGEGYKKIGSGWSTMLPNNRYYIRCAWIAVDEILNANGLHPNDTDYDYNKAELYWQEVKQEIEKL